MRRVRGPVSSLFGSGGSSLSMVRNGIVLALIPVLWGLFPLISGHYEHRGRGGRTVLDGWSARALGLAAIALGACLHVHFYWSRHDSLSEFRRPAMVVSVLVFLGALGFLALA